MLITSNYDPFKINNKRKRRYLHLHMKYEIDNVLNHTKCLYYPIKSAKAAMGVILLIFHFSNWAKHI